MKATRKKPSTNRYGELTYKPYKAPTKKKVSRPKPPAPVEEEPKPQPKEERKEPMAEHPKLDKIREIASRVGGKIRNLENRINAARSTPPDPEIAAEFDGIQRDIDALKDPDSAPTDNGDEDNGKKGAKKK